MKLELSSNSDQLNDTLEIDDLEYDVASVGSIESSHVEHNQAGYYFITYRLPEHS